MLAFANAVDIAEARFSYSTYPMFNVQDAERSFPTFKLSQPTIYNLRNLIWPSTSFSAIQPQQRVAYGDWSIGETYTFGMSLRGGTMVCDQITFIFARDIVSASMCKVSLLITRD